jgi:hypothetical protein
MDLFYIAKHLTLYRNQPPLKTIIIQQLKGGYYDRSTYLLQVQP